MLLNVVVIELGLVSRGLGIPNHMAPVHLRGITPARDGRPHKPVPAPGGAVKERGSSAAPGSC